ncbi:MAG: histidine kinase [Pseudomonadota bacterium]
MPRVVPQLRQPQNLIPDFCQARALLILAGVMLGVGAVLTLMGPARGREALMQFLLSALFLLWLGFCGAALLCRARRWLSRANPQFVFAVCWGLLLAMTVVLSYLAHVVAQYVSLGAVLPDDSRWLFVLRNGCVGAIVSLLVLRYFWLRQQWAEQLRAEADARHDALRARIQPHFLFNSLNSIAALVAIKPDDAERMIEDLSALLRAGLDVRTQIAPLAEELEIVEAYLRIEQVRLGERLRIEREIPDALLRWEVPLLCVQPLVENAVTHGISRRAEGGVLRLHARAEGDLLVIKIENPVVDAATDRPGHQLSLDNIAQRLALIYGEPASLETGIEGDRFCARLRIPRTRAA